MPISIVIINPKYIHIKFINMKNFKLNGFEIYLLQESLKYYKSLISKEEFPNIKLSQMVILKA